MSGAAISLGYFADGPWSHRALELITADARFKVLFIVPRFDSRDPVLAAWATRLGIPFLPIEKVNAPEAVSQLASFGADLFVSMSFDQILKAPIREVAPLGFINCHAGALPFYRGRNILNWALINDEKSFGVTVHKVDEGIDTGDILVQHLLPITDRDTYASLLERAIVACASALHETLSGFADGSLQARSQASVHPVGSYFGRRGPGDEWIDWSWDSRRVFNFIRAITTPGPGAGTVLNERTLRILSAQMIPGAPAYIATRGEVVGFSAAGPIVKTGDTTLLVTQWAADDGQPVRLKRGDRLASSSSLSSGKRNPA